jgi:hypothetical protein
MRAATGEADLLEGSGIGLELLASLLRQVTRVGGGGALHGAEAGMRARGGQRAGSGSLTF